MANKIKGIPANTALIDTVFDNKVGQRVTIIYLEEETIYHCINEKAGYKKDIKEWIGDELFKRKEITTVVPAPRAETFFKKGEDIRFNGYEYSRGRFTVRSYDLLEVYTVQVVKSIQAAIKESIEKEGANG